MQWSSDGLKLPKALHVLYVLQHVMKGQSNVSNCQTCWRAESHSTSFNCPFQRPLLPFSRQASMCFHISRNSCRRQTSSHVSIKKSHVLMHLSDLSVISLTFWLSYFLHAPRPWHILPLGSARVLIPGVHRSSDLVKVYESIPSLNYHIVILIHYIDTMIDRYIMICIYIYFFFRRTSTSIFFGASSLWFLASPCCFGHNAQTHE